MKRKLPTLWTAHELRVSSSTSSTSSTLVDMGSELKRNGASPQRVSDSQSRRARSPSGSLIGGSPGCFTASLSPSMASSCASSLSFRCSSTGSSNHRHQHQSPRNHGVAHRSPPPHGPSQYTPPGEVARVSTPVFSSLLHSHLQRRMQLAGSKGHANRRLCLCTARNTTPRRQLRPSWGVLRGQWHERHNRNLPRGTSFWVQNVGQLPWGGFNCLEHKTRCHASQ